MTTGGGLTPSTQECHAMLYGGAAYRKYIAAPPRKGSAEANLILGTRGRVGKLVGSNVTESDSEDDQGGYDDTDTRSKLGGHVDDITTPQGGQWDWTQEQHERPPVNIDR